MQTTGSTFRLLQDLLVCSICGYTRSAAGGASGGGARLEEDKGKGEGDVAGRENHHPSQSLVRLIKYPNLGT